jgi:hypothetical protein
MLLTSLGRVLVASGLVAVTSFMASTAAFAAPKTANANVAIIGSVASSLTFTAVSSATPLNIETLVATPSTVQSVAVLSYTTNANGLKVTVGSTSLALASDNLANPPTPISYELATGAAAPTNGFVGPGGQLFETTSPNLSSASTNLYIRQASGSSVAVYPGTYKQNIFLTATDK